MLVVELINSPHRCAKMILPDWHYGANITAMRMAATADDYQILKRCSLLLLYYSQA